MRALLDACVLYPWTLRDFLMRIAQAGAFTPVWSDEILDEFVGAILRNRKDMPAARLERTRSLMEAAFPRACVQVDAERASIPDASPGCVAVKRGNPVAIG